MKRAHVSKLDSLFDPVNCFRRIVPTYKQMDIFARLLDEIIPTLLDPKFLDISQFFVGRYQVKWCIHPFLRHLSEKNAKRSAKFEAFSFRVGGFFQNNSSILPAFIEPGILGTTRFELDGVGF